MAAEATAPQPSLDDEKWNPNEVIPHAQGEGQYNSSFYL
jgi:hypothetical protein